MVATISSEVAKVPQNLLNELLENRSCGQLVIENRGNEWHLYFLRGRLLYAIAAKHRVRRWTRSLKQACPEFQLDTKTLQSSNKLWEYDLLHQAVSQNQLTIAQAKSVIRINTQEIFFALASNSNWRYRWFPGQTALNNIPFNLTLSALEIEQAFERANQQWQQWQNKGLGHINPELAPILKQQQSSQTGFVQYLNGQNTLWDIAYIMRRPVEAVANALLPFVEKGAIELKEVPDLAANFLLEQNKINDGININSHQKQPLIACIDDSPVIAQALENILKPAGYRILKITQPLQQMSTLVKNKPDLIFLDLVMPDASGHSLCSFMRKTPAFRETPIVILTSKDGLVDRTRAKLTGASDFLVKPPEAEKVLQVIHKYLKV